MKKTERRDAERVALGTAATLGVYLALLALSALLLTRGRVEEGSASVCISVSAALASCVGVKTAAWGAAKPMTPALLCVCLSACVMLLLGYMVYDAMDARRVLYLAASLAAGGVCALLIRGRKRGKKRASRPRR